MENEEKNEEKLEHWSADKIAKLASEVDEKAISAELTDWLIENVEEYVDNSQEFYRVYLDKTRLDDLPALNDVQGLYLRVPSNEETEKQASIALQEAVQGQADGKTPDEIEAMIEKKIAEAGCDIEALKEQERAMAALRALEARIKEAIPADKERMSKLFSRLIYYYEMVGYSKADGAILQDFEGYVELHEFLYDPIAMDVTVKQKLNKQLPDGSIEETGEDGTVTTVHVPESFVIELILHKWPKKPSMSMY